MLDNLPFLSLTFHLFYLKERTPRLLHRLFRPVLLPWQMMCYRSSLTDPVHTIPVFPSRSCPVNLRYTFLPSGCQYSLRLPVPYTECYCVYRDNSLSCSHTGLQVSVSSWSPQKYTDAPLRPDCSDKSPGHQFSMCLHVSTHHLAHIAVQNTAGLLKVRQVFSLQCLFRPASHCYHLGTGYWWWFQVYLKVWSEMSALLLLDMHLRLQLRQPETHLPVYHPFRPGCMPAECTHYH